MKTLLSGLIAAIAATLSGTVYAQSIGGGKTTQITDWPAKTIRMIVSFPSGSPPDIVARLLNEKLSIALGQPVIIENRPGAGGNIGISQVAKAAPDGYTIGLSAGGPFGVNKLLYSNLDYDPLKDLTFISLVAASPMVLVVDPKLGIASLKDFVALAKSRPGKLDYGSAGNGTAGHLAMELLKRQAGIDIVHIPYAGSLQVNTAIVGGQIAGGFVTPTTVMPLVQSGRMLALAVASSTRTPLIPDLPTVVEEGYPGFQSTGWIGIVAPTKTPKPIIDRISAELVRIIQTEEMRSRMRAIYFQAIGTSSEGLATMIREEMDRWSDIIKLTGTKAD